MINVLLEGQSSIQDYRELLRLLYIGKDINYIESISEYNKEGYLIYNIYNLDSDYAFTESKLYKDDILLKESKRYLSNINVGRDSLKKKLNVGIKQTLIDISPKRDLPWGILTGIRPTKIVRELNEKNIDEVEQFRILNEEYLLDREKIQLMNEIVKIQEKHIYPIDNNSYSIYIGIPFCPTKCHYCSFPSVTVDGHEKYIDEYIEKLIYEIDSTYKYVKNMKLNNVYIGGGTPTAIPKELLGKLIDFIYSRFGRDNIKEFTVEAGRPDTLNEDYLKLLKSKGIDRISINPQTMNDKTLEKIGRNHTSDDIENIYYMAKEIGFKSINMDLIVGLPGEGREEVINTLEKVEEMNPENLTVHTLAIKRGANLKGNEKLKSKLQEQEILDMLTIVDKETKKMKLFPYYLYRQKQILGNFENIGYAKKDLESLYNISMMEEKETILGFGMGSVSKIYSSYDNKIYRIPNFKSLDEYFNRLDELVERKKLALMKIK